MQNPKVTISVINYNDKKFIFKAIESAVGQNFLDLEIIITDNNSTDGTREEIEKRIPEWKEKRRKIIFYSDLSEVRGETKGGFKENKKAKGFKNNYCQSLNRHQDGVEFVKYIKNNENAGFGRPHNQAIREAKGDFVLLLNSDAILTENYIEEILKPFSDPKVGAVQGKLLRYDFDKNELYKSKENSELNIIDTTGLMMFKNRRIVCIGQGQPDQGQFEVEKEIFGADGAIPVYRKEALEDVKLPKLEIVTTPKSPPPPLLKGEIMTTPLTPISSRGERESDSPLERGEGCVYEYFDENFFMYKEDVDLAWRLRLAGWKTIYAPKAIAYHGRGSGDSMAKNYIDIIKERRKINMRAKYLSFKHQRLMQIKNDFPSLLFTKHFPRFIIKEAGAWIYMMIFERFTFKVLKDLYRDVPLFLKKRKMVMAKKRMGVREMEKWFI